MAQTFAPYMTLINDPTLSKTGGNWAADLVPGYTDKGQSRSWVDGHFLAVPKYAKNADWSIEFIRMACSKKWQLRSMERGNAPPRGSALNDPTMAEKLGWPPTAAHSIETGVPHPGASGMDHHRADTPHWRIRSPARAENRQGGARRGRRRLAAHLAARRHRARLKHPWKASRNCHLAQSIFRGAHSMAASIKKAVLSPKTASGVKSYPPLAMEKRR
jgi:hypothetical protein